MSTEVPRGADAGQAAAGRERVDGRSGRLQTHRGIFTGDGPPQKVRVPGRLQTRGCAGPASSPCFKAVRAQPYALKSHAPSPPLRKKSCCRASGLRTGRREAHDDQYVQRAARSKLAVRAVPARGRGWIRLRLLAPPCPAGGRHAFTRDPPKGQSWPVAGASSTFAAVWRRKRARGFYHQQRCLASHRTTLWAAAGRLCSHARGGVRNG